MANWTTDFAGGNGQIHRIHSSSDTWDVTFAAESRGGEPRPLWFYFRLNELEPSTHRYVRLHILNAAQCMGDPLGWTNNRLVYRAADGAWQRSEMCTVQKQPDYTLDTVCRIPCIASEMEVAFCYPYTESDFQQAIGQDTSAAVIGVTSHGRPIHRYILGHPSRDTKGLYVIARQHSSEVTGSYLLDGMIRAAREEPTSGSLWCVPFGDTDGVAEGLYGKDQRAGDFNRAWDWFFARRTETAAMFYDIEQFREATEPIWVLDLHSPGHDETSSYFVTPFREDSKDRRLLRLLELCDRFNAELRMAGYKEVSIRFAHGNTSAQIGKSADEHLTDAGLCAVTLECAYQGEPGLSYTQADYRRIGALLYRAIVFHPEDSAGCTSDGEKESGIAPPTKN